MTKRTVYHTLRNIAKYADKHVLLRYCTI